ncbi:hypothetical protein Tco_0628686 [Tanacetum coccineum]|uniref:Reverse transcriptase domain-containing protein n=1 Tax=Tanacetum coccineum TaxID=301880 RepID=A0ABQ4WR02_9ASTR
MSVLDSRENATLKKRLAETKLVLARMECEPLRGGCMSPECGIRCFTWIMEQVVDIKAEFMPNMNRRAGGDKAKCGWSRCSRAVVKRAGGAGAGGCWSRVVAGAVVPIRGAWRKVDKSEIFNCYSSSHALTWWNGIGFCLPWELMLANALEVTRTEIDGYYKLIPRNGLVVVLEWVEPSSEGGAVYSWVVEEYTWKGKGDRGGRGDNRRDYNHRQNQRRANAGAMTNAAPNDNEVCPKCKNKKHFWSLTRIEGEAIKNVPVIRDISPVFLDELTLTLPPFSEFNIRIDLILGAAPVARVPYRLAPSKMKELSKKMQELSLWGAPILFIPWPLIDRRGFHVDPAKIKAIKIKLQPTTPTEVQQFWVWQCLTCAKVKAGHQKLSGLLQQPEIPVLEMGREYIGFHYKSLRTHLDKINFVGHCWRCPKSSGPEMIRETTEMIVQIKNRLLAARSRQKSYADVRRKPLEFEVGDKVMLKVSPWKGVVRFGKLGN